MRFFSLIPALVALAVAVTGVALPAKNVCVSEIGCELVQPASGHLSPPSAVRGLTNAERLRRGLPLKKPVLRRGTPVRRTNPSSTPTQDPKDPGKNPNTISHRGAIQVINAASGVVLGYVSKSLLKRAQLRHQPGTDSALTVTFETDSTGSGTNLNLAMTNSDAGFTLLGLVQGVEDNDSVLSSGSFQFAVLAGVETPGTTPGALPVKIGNSYSSAHELMRAAETAVWTFDASKGTLTPRWVNPDGSIPMLQSFAQSDGTIYFTGDMDAFTSKYSSPATSISFKFVSS